MSELAAYQIAADDIKWMQERFLERGEVIDAETAFRKLQLLVLQMDLVYRPVTKKQVQQVNEYGDVNEPRRPRHSS